MKSKLVIMLLAALLLGASYYAGRYTAPTKTVEKVVTVKKVIEVERKNVQTVVKETKRPDGTVEKETKTIDLSVTERQESKQQESKKVVEAAKPQWKIGVGAGLTDFRGQVMYAGSIERRVLGPVFAGVQAVPQLGYYGASLSVEF